MTITTPKDIDKGWNKFFFNITGKKSKVKITKLMKSKWPELYSQVTKRHQTGINVQAAVTGLLDQCGVKVVDVECDCVCAECVAERAIGGNPPHDVDVLVELECHNVPIQIGQVQGELLHNYDNVVSKHGGVDTKSVNGADTELIRKKIRQTPPGGITLLVTNVIISPSEDWWYNGINKKCLVLWQNGSCSIYHGIGGCVDAAKKLCGALGDRHARTYAIKPRHSPNLQHKKHLPFHPETAEGLTDTIRKDIKKWTGNPDDVIGALYYPTYASAYFDALWPVSDIVQADNLVPIVRHVMERHRESAAEKAPDQNGWRHAVSDMLLALQEMARTDTKFSLDVLVEICDILQDIASGRHEPHKCNTLSDDVIYSRIHLQALFCLTYMVGRLRENTPSKVRETLTAAARTGGKEGEEYRIVFGNALDILQSAIPRLVREERVHTLWR